MSLPQHAWTGQRLAETGCARPPPVHGLMGSTGHVELGLGCIQRIKPSQNTSLLLWTHREVLFPPTHEPDGLQHQHDIAAVTPSHPGPRRQAAEPRYESASVQPEPARLVQLMLTISCQRWRCVDMRTLQQ